MNILVLNPGGNSLKAEIVSCSASQQYAFEGKTLLSITIEGIGKDAELSRMDDKKVLSTEKISAADYGAAAQAPADMVRCPCQWCRVEPRRSRCHRRAGGSWRPRICSPSTYRCRGGSEDRSP